MKSLTLTLPLLPRHTYRVNSGIAAGSLAMVINVISSSTFPVFGKQLAGSFSPLSLLFVGEIMGGIFVLLSFGFLPLLKIVWSLKHTQKIYLAIGGVITGIVAPYMWYMGLLQTTAINAGLFSRSEAIFLILFSALFLKESIGKKQYLSLIVILFGVMFVALKGFTVGFTMQMGDVLIIVSSCLYAIGGIIVKKLLNDVHPEAIIFARAFSATVLFILCTMFYTHTLGSELRNIDPSLITVLLCYGFLTRFLGIYSFHEAIDKLKVSTVSMMGTLSIVGSIFFAAAYLGEYIHWYQTVGGAVIVIGVMMMQYFGIHATSDVHKHHIRSHHNNHF
ncbi:MAG: DMT family transporter [bacterium]|nr:DMT family transporter [bacterium]